MNLDVSDWKEFRFGELISDIYKAKAINKDDLNEATDPKYAIRYITRTGENNGCELLADVRDVDDRIIEKGNAISIGDTTATCFFQDKDFITGDHMVIVRADAWLNRYTALFIIALLNNEQFKYSYGRAFLKDRIQDTIIKLPVTPDGGPDWEFMERYVKSLKYKFISTSNGLIESISVDSSKWKEYRVGDYFDIHPTKTIEGVSSSDCGKDGFPLIVNSSENNGVAGLCDYEPTEEGNIITFSDTTDGNTFFYQPDPFIGFAHVQGMYPKDDRINKYVMIYICAMLTFDAKGRYNYGRKMRRDTISKVRLKLPTTVNGEPDWNYMEEYIKSLPYGDRI